MVFQDEQLFPPPRRRRQRRVRAEDAGRLRPDRGATGGGTAADLVGSPGSATAASPTSAAARRSGWPSPGRWRRRRGRCCSTSRSPDSTGSCTIGSPASSPRILRQAATTALLVTHEKERGSGEPGRPRGGQGRGPRSVPRASSPGEPSSSGRRSAPPPPSRGLVLDGDDEPTTVHLGARDGAGRLVGVSTWLRPPARRGGGRRVQLRAMATAPDVRGQGAGDALLGAGRRARSAAPDTVVWARARDTALGFYRHGFEVVEPGFVDETTGLPHHVIVLRLSPPDVDVGPGRRSRRARRPCQRPDRRRSFQPPAILPFRPASSEHPGVVRNYMSVDPMAAEYRRRAAESEIARRPARRITCQRADEAVGADHVVRARAPTPARPRSPTTRCACARPPPSPQHALVVRAPGRRRRRRRRRRPPRRPAGERCRASVTTRYVCGPCKGLHHRRGGVAPRDLERGPCGMKLVLTARTACDHLEQMAHADRPDHRQRQPW